MLSRGTSAPLLLILEDSETRTLLESYLASRGVRVQCANDGREAIGLALERPFAAVVLDLTAPGSRRFLEAREQDIRLYPLPVLLLTDAPEELSSLFTARFHISSILRAPGRGADILEAVRMRQRSDPDAARHRVLIVDDDREILLGLTLRLKSKGLQVDCACDGPTALAEAATHHPDIVILDLGLPFMDGFEVLERLRLACPSAPVIVLTARDPAKAKDRAMRAGAFRFLQKPAQNADLIRAVDEALAHHTRLVAA